MAGAPPGVRQQKKERTKSAIREHAIRLFRRDGYQATTIDHIAEAAGVSSRTFFRYFSTKEAVVLDVIDYEPLLLAAFVAQPVGLTPIRALRMATVDVLRGLTAPQMAGLRERTVMAFAVPEVRAAWLNTQADVLSSMAEMVAARVGRKPTDFAVRIFAAAVVGTMIAVQIQWVENPELDLAALADEALADLEAGVPI
jgi:AcrR family transcriptional regulator